MTLWAGEHPASARKGTQYEAIFVCSGFYTLLNETL